MIHKEVKQESGKGNLVVFFATVLTTVSLTVLEKLGKRATPAISTILSENGVYFFPKV